MTVWRCKEKAVKLCRLSTKGRNTFGKYLNLLWLNTADPIKADVESDSGGSSQSMSEDTKHRPQSQSHHNSALQLQLMGTGARQKRLSLSSQAARLDFMSTSSQCSSSCAKHPVPPSLAADLSACVLPYTVLPPKIGPPFSTSAPSTQV